MSEPPDSLISQFGWEGDNGLGERLIQKIIRGEKTATNCPKCLYSSDETEGIFGTVGKVLTVVDKMQTPRCEIRQIEVFETTFGNPDLKLVAGEGFGTDAEAFKKAHMHVWDDLFAEKGLALTDETILIAEMFCCVAEVAPND